MKKQNKNSLLTLSLISLISLLLFSCKSEEIEMKTTNMKDLPDEVGDYVSVTAMKGEQKEYVLHARSYKRFIKENLTYMDSVYLESYDEMEQLASTLVCDSANVDEVKNLMIARNNVVVNSENGVLKTDYLEWNQSTNEIYAKGWVELNRNNHTLKGFEMHTDINLDRVTMINVEAKGKVEEGEFEWEE